MNLRKPIKHAISIVLLNKNKETLFALRNKHKKSYPNTWSLPSHFVEEGETFEDTIKRIGKNKLGCELEKDFLLKENKFEREKFILFMHVYQVKLISGKPKVNTTSYQKIKWEDAKTQFNEMDVFGACTTLYKEYLK